MKKHWKRLLSALLVLVMVLSVLPAAAFATVGQSVNVDVYANMMRLDGAIVFPGKIGTLTGSPAADDGSFDLTLTQEYKEFIRNAVLDDSRNGGIVYGNGIDSTQISSPGWSMAPGSDTVHISGQSMKDLDITAVTGWKLYLNYVELAYTVHFGTTATEENKAYSASIPIPEVPEMPGKKAVGWSTGTKIFRGGANVTISALFADQAHGVHELTLEPVYRDTQDYLVLWVDSMTGLIYDYETVAEDGTAAAVADPTKEGYTFTGWDKATMDPITADTVFFAQWKADTNNITYINASGVPSAQTGDTVTVTATPDQGYTIDSVSVRDAGGTYYPIMETENGTYQFTMPAKDVTVQATQTATQITAQFKVDGNVVETQTLAYGGTPRLPDAPTKEGHTFLGWRPEGSDNLYNDQTPLVPIFGDVTYDAVFDAEGYTLTYHRGAEADDSVNKCLLELPDGKIVEMYNNDGPDKPTYTVDAVLNLGATVILAKPMLPGYKFLGWQDESGYTHPAGAKFQMPAKDVHLTALWEEDEAQTVLVRFVSDGEVYSAFLAYEGETAQIPAVDPTVPGKKFDGWRFEDKTYSNQGVKDFTVTSNGAREMTLEAQWTTDSYTVTYNVDGALDPVQNLSYGQEIVLRDAPTKDGFTFQAWKSGKNAYYLAGSAYAVKGNETFTAIWSEDSVEYTVKFLDENGSLFDIEIVSAGERITAPEYTLAAHGDVYRWEGGNSHYNSGEIITVNSDLVLKATRTSQTKYDVTVEVTPANAPGNVTNLGAKSMAPGETGVMTITVPAGYTLKAVSANADNGAAVAANLIPNGNGAYTYRFTMPASDLKILVELEEIPAGSTVVKFVSDGQLFDYMIVEKGSTGHAPDTAPEKEGKTFKGWNKGSETLQSGDPFQVAKDAPDEIVYTAKWENLTYLVQYDANGGDTTPSSENKSYGEEITLADAPKKNGYVFIGWVEASTGFLYSAGATYTVKGDVTFTARWEVGKCVVRFLDPNTGVIYGYENVEKGTRVTAPAAPQVSGRTFLHWVNQDDSADQVGESALTPEIYQDTVYEAVFETSTHTIAVSTQHCSVDPSSFSAAKVGDLVSFTVNADTDYAVDTVTISYVDGTSFVVRELTAVNGTYSFRMPDADVTITATAVQNVFAVFTDSDAHGVITLKTPKKAEAGSVVRFLAESSDPAYKVSVITVHTDGTNKPLSFSMDTDGSYEFVMPAEDVKISVQTKRAQHTVTFLDSDNTLLGIVSVDSGDTVNPIADPQRDGYTFDHWERLPEKESFNPAVTPVKEDLTLRAVYTGERHDVSKGLGDHVKVLRADCTLSTGDPNSSDLLQKPLKAETGRTVYFTVAAERDYTITNVCVVSAQGSDLVVEPVLREKKTVGEIVYYTYAFTMPAEDVQIDVYTAPKSFKVTVEENLPEGGTYTINGYTSTNLMIPQGEEVTIQVTPADGYILKNITGTYLDSRGNTAQLNGNFDPAQGTYVFQMISRDVTIHVEYEPKSYEINVSDSNAESYKPDTGVKPIGPAENLDDNFTSKGRITLNGVANVTVTDGQGNFWEVPGNGQAKVGSRISFKVEEFTGYRLVAVHVTYDNGEKSCPITTRGDTFFFDMPADDVVVSAEFEEISNQVIKAPSAENHGNVTINDLRETKVSVDYKDLVEVVVTPDAGYQVTKIYYVLSNGTVVDFDSAKYQSTSTLSDTLDTAHSLRFHMPATNVTVYAEYAPIDYSISDVSQNAATTYKTPKNVGNTVKFTVKPDKGYIISKVFAETESGKIINVHTSSTNPLHGASYDFTMPAAPVTIHVETIKDQYNVKYLDNGTLVGYENVEYMGTAHVSRFTSAVSNGKAGYHFTGWLSGDVYNPVSVPSVADKDFRVVGDTVIQAAYEKDQIHVHFLPTKNGTVKELSTGSTAEYVLKTTVFGDTVRFSVTPKKGYVVDQVLVSSTDQDGYDTQIRCAVSANFYTFRIPATYKNSIHDVRAEDVKVQVTFKKAVYNLTEAAASQHDGTIAINGTVTTQTSFRYDFADQVTITATPKDGYYVKSIVAVNRDKSEKYEVFGTKPAADTKAGKDLTLKFKMPASNLSYTVCFEKIDYTITAKYNQTQGSVTTNPATSAQLGDLVKVNVATKEGYLLKKLTVTYDGGRKSCSLTKIGASTYTFVMPAQAVTVTAEFTEQAYIAGLKAQGEGTVTLNGYYTDNMTADYLDTVTVNVAPAKGWQLKSILVDGGKVVLNEAVKAEGGNYTFTMPNRDVDVEVILDKVSYEVTAYAINFFENGHGKVNLNVAETANAGDRITITADPDDGYRVKEVVVQDKNGNSVPVSYVTGTADYTETWSFTMPASAVEVTVIFEVYGSSYYTDVRTDHWFYDAVTFVTDRGYFYGVSDELFGPNIDMSRAMFVTVLGRISKVDVNQYQKKTFEDVSVSSYYGPYVAWAAENGIVYGRSATEFDPNASITREEMSAIMYRYCRFLGVDMTPQNQVFMDRYEDVGKISGWAMDSVKWAVGVGLIKGTSSTTIDPLSQATRAQVAQVIKNLCDKVLYR